MSSKSERKRKKRPVVAKTGPGFCVLPEDLRRRYDMEAVAVGMKPRERVPGECVRNRVHEAVPMRDVQARVMRAMKTLRALPDREARFLKVGSAWPSYVQEYMDAYNSVEAIAPRFNPNPFDISDFLRALDWTRHLQNPQWRLLWWRSFDLSFGAIGRRIGQSDETVRRKFRDTMIDVWSVANSVEA